MKETKLKLFPFPNFLNYMNLNKLNLLKTKKKEAKLNLKSSSTIKRST